MSCHNRRLCGVGVAVVLGLTIASGFASTVSQAIPGAVLRGKIVLDGDAPPPQNISMVADPYCTQFVNLTEDVRVSDRGLENVMVYVSSSLSGAFPPPEKAVTFDQRNCRYEPHVLTIQVGQTLLIRNGDATVNSVRSIATANRPFNIALSMKGTESRQIFDTPETPIRLRSDVHKWMTAFVGVFSHPYHTVSKAGGAYELWLPVGEHQITVWHEKYGSSQQTIRIEAGGSPTLNFAFK